MDLQALYGWGVPFGRIAGIRIRLHWILLIFWANELTQILNISGIPRGYRLSLWTVAVASSFLLILVHELGHCFAARRVGGQAQEILLWPLGGLAMVYAPNAWSAQLAVAAGGPIANALCVGAAWAVFSAIPAEVAPWLLGVHLSVAKSMLVEFNLYVLAFNLVPIYPLDGGRMFHAAIWGFLTERRGDRSGGYQKASVATLWATRILAVAGLVWAIRESHWFLGLILIWALGSAEQFFRNIRAGIYTDEWLEYAASRGYRTLERPARKARIAAAVRRFFRRLRRIPSPEEESRRLDAILEKIAREGMDSLTRKERTFLESYARRHR